MKDRSGSFHPPDPPPTEETEQNQEVVTEPDSVKPKSKPRVKVDKAEIFTEQFENAFEIFYREVQNAKMEDWQNTSKEAAYWHVDKITNLISIS